MTRTLRWDGCCNVRDLGGLPTEDGSETRFRVVVRADDLSQLAPMGWEALTAYGVSRIVDLRHEGKPYESPVEVVRLPVLDPVGLQQVDELLAGEADPAAWRRRNYLFFLDRYGDKFGDAVAAVAAASAGTVLVHCGGGADRTGIVSALLLRLAGVDVETVAGDWAESACSWAPAVGTWIEQAPDEHERRKRRFLWVMPSAAMRDVLRELERRHGSIASYLQSAGVDGAALDRIRERLRG